MKRIRIILLLVFLFALSLAGVAADDESKTNSEFTKSSFKKTSSGPSMIPGTGGAGSGGGGAPIPVSGGFIVLVIGSIIYLSKKVRDDIKK